MDTWTMGVATMTECQRQVSRPLVAMEEEEEEEEEAIADSHHSRE